MKPDIPENIKTTLPPDAPLSLFLLCVAIQLGLPLVIGFGLVTVFHFLGWFGL
jgi:hypothetical protein